MTAADEGSAMSTATAHAIPIGLEEIALSQSTG